jgi:hypothetical protein
MREYALYNFDAHCKVSFQQSAQPRARSFQSTGRSVSGIIMFVESQPLNCKDNAELNVEARRRRRLNAEILRRNAEILGGGPAFFLASVRRGGAASTEIASWGAAGCPAIGAGRAD